MSEEVWKDTVFMSRTLKYITEHYIEFWRQVLDILKKKIMPVELFRKINYVFPNIQNLPYNTSENLYKLANKDNRQVLAPC